eukprot:3651965-Pyramimonas_sp.AAC.1
MGPVQESYRIPWDSYRSCIGPYGIRSGVLSPTGSHGLRCGTLGDSHRSITGSYGYRIGVLWKPMGFVEASCRILWYSYGSPIGSDGIRIERSPVGSYGIRQGAV